MKAGMIYGAIILGFLCLGLSSAWSTLFPATSSWTAEKEARWTQVKQRMHTHSFVVAGSQPVNMHRGPETGQAKQEYETLKKENEQLKAEFQSAADRPSTISKILKWSGISLAIVGIVGWYAVKDSS
jgi:hypothetical protein